MYYITSTRSGRRVYKDSLHSPRMEQLIIYHIVWRGGEGCPGSLGRMGRAFCKLLVSVSSLSVQARQAYPCSVHLGGVNSRKEIGGKDSKSFQYMPHQDLTRGASFSSSNCKCCNAPAVLRAPFIKFCIPLQQILVHTATRPSHSTCWWCNTSSAAVGKGSRLPD